jgi:PKD repeat protein
MKNNLQPIFSFYFILISSLLLFSYSDAFAQKNCQTSETEFYLNNKDKVTGSEEFEKKLNGYIIQKREEVKNNPLLYKVQKTEATYRIPIIVHVIHNGEPIGEGTNISAAQIYGQIEVLNEDFNFTNPDKDETLAIFKTVAANPSIEFVPATIDPNGNPLREPGINRSKGCFTSWNNITFDLYGKPTTVWNPNNYFNIWVTNLTEYGYGQFPILSNLDGIRNESKGASTDGIVVKYRNFGSIEKTPTIPQLIASAPLNFGRTATHEVGHFFGLLHTWEGDLCTTDDFCDDTPNKSQPQRQCNLNEPSCEAGKVAMVQNFMDYTYDECMTLFTKDQVTRMQAVLAISPRRKELLTSRTAEPIINKLFSIFESSKQKVIKGGKIKFTDKSLATGNKQIDVYQWTFDGGTPATSNQQNPTITYSQQGNFTATLKVLSNDGTENTSSIPIEVLDDNRTALNETLLDFEDRNFQKDGWAIERTDIANWRLFSNGAYNASNFSAFAPNKDNRSCEAQLAFISPLIQTPTNRIFEIRFDVAYAYTENKISDSLQISYATDGGDKFVTIWTKAGEELKTTLTQTTTTFSPLPSEWKTHSLYVEVEQGSRFIQVKFKNKGENNNNLYLDNLRIRQATDLQLPIVDFDVSYPLILLSEKARLYSKTEFGVDFNWTITGNTISQTTGISPQISFSQEGVYGITLKSSNSLGTRELTKTEAIKVITGKKISNITSQNLKNEVLNNKPLAGHDEGNTTSKAEFFNALEANTKIYAVDIFFANAALTNLNKTFEVVMWSVDANGKPNTELYRQKAPYSLIHKDIFEKRQFTRVVFDEAQNIPTQFFVSVELEYESGNTFSIFTEKKQEGKGWERKANGDWLSYSASRGQNYSNAISVILSPDGILGVDDEDNLNDLVSLYPNPNQGSFSLETQNLRVESIEIYNSIGQIVYQKNVPNTFISNFDIQLKQPSNGMYLVKIQTQKGIITQKIIIQN